ncbi:hypothetical protein EJ08DRAFT_666080 [Tothia fuscella]|uniref:Uncharacterized protein n=1 Tax=Tothia fuscella TaxID=1048955 RepID=A0A9P4NF60_9PEZI|nr:hypothetical protein EJ08DRAFT_666080 [Tothia fuscella]
MDPSQSLQEVDLTDLPPNDDIPEEAEDLTVSDDTGHEYAPPARIAARFYRPSASRRKSSAASSRRNSLTSNHSQLSNSSYRAACKSNHVAQYLRRASIIESRKARLAAREAHAEQVRLRAALAKSAPRGSNSEERALAAQQAREKHLALVASTCAEEVRRAKKKAEEMREKRAADEERYRVEMEEKHAEVERRRMEYKRTTRRPRTASTPPGADVKKSVIDATSKLDEDAAARLIQIAWKTQRRKRMLDAFNGLGLSIDQVHDTSFEDVSSKLLDENVLAITTRVLELYNLYQNDESASATPTLTPTRNFLTAYLILGHPAQVFNKDGAQESDLITKAKDLVLSFETALSKSTIENRYTPPPTPLESLHLTHTAYLTAFNDWKAQDASTLISMMVGSFVNLDSIWQSVKDDTDGEVNSDYRDGIRDNQITIYSKLRRLAGRDRADALIRKAIRESRRSIMRKKPAGDVRPRVAPENVAIHPEPNDPSAPLTVAPDIGSHIATALPESEADQSRAITRLFSVMPDNRTLTHELAINKDYRVGSDSGANTRDEIYRKVCDKMLEAFRKDEKDAAVWTASVAENIRAKLLHLVGKPSPSNTTRNMITEILDPELIGRQCAQGSFSYQTFFSFMAGLLPKLCAPFRDEEVKVLCQDMQHYGNVEEMIEKVFKLLHMIDLFSLDYSNFLLTAVAPKLIQEAPGYEQRMFAKDLDEGVITLQKTKRWWKNANVNVVTEIDRRDPTSSPTVQKIYARGLVDLAIASTHLKDTEVPETLQLDIKRLTQIRADAVRITIIGSILLTAKNILKRDVRSQWKPEATQMWEVLKAGYGKEDDTVPINMCSIIERARPMPPNVKSSVQSYIARILPQGDTGRFIDPVVKVLFQRLKTHIFNRISASSSGERVRVATTAGEGLASNGLPEFISQVGEMVDTLNKLSDVDRRAHGVWYEQVAKECEAMGSEDEEAA